MERSGSVGSAGRPVATTVVATTFPFSYAIRLCVLSVTTISLPSAFAAGAGVGDVTIGLAVAVGSAGTGGTVAAATDGARVADGVGSSATGSGVGK